MTPSVRVLPDRAALGVAAAADIAAALDRAIRDRGRARVVFAAAPSQESTLRALAARNDVDWPRVTAFHMDEYVGLPAGSPQRFGSWLRRTLFDDVPVGDVQLMTPDNGVAAELARYAGMITAAPIDVVCCGIGVNGHLAFNDPPADFRHPETVARVHLDETSRRQQVDDGCFPDLADVPTEAMTLTVPALVAAAEIFCMVPGRAKQQAVRGALLGPVDPAVPASVLQRHPCCTVYLDVESAPDDPDR